MRTLYWWTLIEKGGMTNGSRNLFRTGVMGRTHGVTWLTYWTGIVKCGH